mmetsp:Transcript_1569/g.1874  ORF Transcript_1569/g.1874 Transcript_1569/m.1874 type:complete len:223 (-) Transcript_1569:879-1547(-)
MVFPASVKLTLSMPFFSLGLLSFFCSSAAFTLSVTLGGSSNRFSIISLASSLSRWVLMVSSSSSFFSSLKSLPSGLENSLSKKKSKPFIFTRKSLKRSLSWKHTLNSRLMIVFELFWKAELLSIPSLSQFDKIKLSNLITCFITFGNSSRRSSFFVGNFSTIALVILLWFIDHGSLFPLEFGLFSKSQRICFSRMSDFSEIEMSSNSSMNKSNSFLPFSSEL